MAQAVKGRLGDRLLEKGLVTEEQLGIALSEQKRFHRPLGEILVSLGFVHPDALSRLVAEDHGLPLLTAAEVEPDPLVLAAVDPAFVRDAGAFPYAVVDGTLRAVMVDPDDPEKLAAVRRRFPYPLEVAMTTEGELLKLVRAHLQAGRSRLAEVLGDRDLSSETPDFPVEEVVEALLLDGATRDATDVHVEPEDRVTRVRYRCDGILHGAENLPRWATPAVVSRIKILARLDISERRRPQDGRLRFEAGEGRTIDVRVSIMPSQHGENVVLRLLDASGSALRLPELGVSAPVQRVLSTIAERPHGLFLVTGPTGSGKTTTLYAMLAGMDAVRRKIATIEDPIEYRLPLLRQSQVDPAIGFDFAAGLRSLLRQDPDVILVGEIRDRETADMAIKASMTGHLVLSTLHTNSALGAVPRLVDIGIEPFLVEDALIGVMAQRLVRRVCPGCRVEAEPSDEERAWLGSESATAWRGEGCERCERTGYRGRTAMVELFLPDAAVAEAVREGAGLERLTAIARRSGFRTMVDHGRELVLAGATTVEEVLRVGRGHRLTEGERAGV